MCQKCDLILIRHEEAEGNFAMVRSKFFGDSSGFTEELRNKPSDQWGLTEQGRRQSELLGQWYQGQHKPIINKELFDKVHKRLGEVNDPRTYDKEFAFTKLLTCGLCGSGVSAYEKFKKLNDGSASRYVYYGCTNSKDLDCKAVQVREEILIDSLLEIIDQVSLDALGLKEKIQKELDKHSKFRSAILGIAKSEQIKSKNIDGKNYLKYILKEGDDYEKREILTCLKTRLIFKDKKLELLK